MGSRLKKGEISQSTKNRVGYSYLALHLFNLMVKANTNAKGHAWRTKKKLSKLDLCRYMAEHNKSFRGLWLATHPGPFPKNMDKRTAIGEQFYRSNVADTRRSRRIGEIEELYKKMFPGKKQEAYYFLKGKKVKIKL